MQKNASPDRFRFLIFVQKRLEDSRRRGGALILARIFVETQDTIDSRESQTRVFGSDRFPRLLVGKNRRPEAFAYALGTIARSRSF